MISAYKKVITSGPQQLDWWVNIFEFTSNLLKLVCLLLCTYFLLRTLLNCFDFVLVLFMKRLGASGSRRHFYLFVLSFQLRRVFMRFGTLLEFWSVVSEVFVTDFVEWVYFGTFFSIFNIFRFLFFSQILVVFLGFFQTELIPF